MAAQRRADEQRDRSPQQPSSIDEVADRTDTDRDSEKRADRSRRDSDHRTGRAAPELRTAPMRHRCPEPDRIRLDEQLWMSDGGFED